MGAPKLSDVDVEKAVKLLDAWQGELTWDRYIAILALEIGHKYTKQGLHKQRRIKAAWAQAKSRLATDQGRRRAESDPAVAHLKEKLAAKDNEIQRLRSENIALLERFRLWAFNAAQAGLSEERLNAPLPDTAYQRRYEPAGNAGLKSRR